MLGSVDLTYHLSEVQRQCNILSHISKISGTPNQIRNPVDFTRANENITLVTSERRNLYAISSRRITIKYDLPQDINQKIDCISNLYITKKYFTRTIYVPHTFFKTSICVPRAPRALRERSTEMIHLTSLHRFVAQLCHIYTVVSDVISAYTKCSSFTPNSHQYAYLTVDKAIWLLAHDAQNILSNYFSMFLVHPQFSPFMLLSCPCLRVSKSVPKACSTVFDIQVTGKSHK